MAWMKSQLPRLVLVLLPAVTLVPLSILVYLQYRSLAQIRRQMHEALLDNVKQALIGARVEAEDVFFQWRRQALVGMEIHDWLRQRDVVKMCNVAETAYRICPHMSVFFAYRIQAGLDAQIFVYRPGSTKWHMDLRKADCAEPVIRSLIPTIIETTSHWYTAFITFDGDRQQVFLHLVDDERDEPDVPRHYGKIGYYGFAVPGRKLASEYLSPLLGKHLTRLTSAGSKTTGDEAVGAVFDETGRRLSLSRNAVTSRFPMRERLDQQTGLLPGWTLRAGFPSGSMDRFDNVQFARGISITLVVAALLLAAIVVLGTTTARATELSRSKSEFVASVSHELKTPLSVIRGFVETLRLDRVSTETQRNEYFQIIETETLRLSNVIDQILESSKIEAGLKRYEPDTVDLAAVIDDTLAHFSHELERESFEIERQIETPLPPVRVDRQAFSQALLNLLSNAVKYSDADRRVTVRAARNNGQLEVSVRDHGIGVPGREQGRIFDRFYRASHTASKTKGVGLGLALVKHFADAHGGSVRVTSAPGRGSTFTILLPLDG
jgi:two-component system, OmpR family, phosphate regulon sensor histidine kinase PhoR